MYYEYDDSLWLKRGGKGGRVKCFCIGGKHKGRKWIMTKEEFSQFKRMRPERDFERMEKLLEVRTNKDASLSI